MSVFDEVKKILARVTHCNEQDITPAMLLKDLKADSLHWVQIIVAVESTFDVEVDIDKMKGFVTVEDFVKHVESLER